MYSIIDSIESTSFDESFLSKGSFGGWERSGQIITFQKTLVEGPFSNVVVDSTVYLLVRLPRTNHVVIFDPQLSGCKMASLFPHTNRWSNMSFPLLKCVYWWWQFLRIVLSNSIRSQLNFGDIIVGISISWTSISTVIPIIWSVIVRAWCVPWRLVLPITPEHDISNYNKFSKAA